MGGEGVHVEENLMVSSYPHRNPHPHPTPRPDPNPHARRVELDIILDENDQLHAELRVGCRIETVLDRLRDLGEMQGRYWGRSSTAWGGITDTNR